MLGIRVQMIQGEVICGTMQRVVDVGASTVTLLVMGVTFTLMGGNSLEGSMDALVCLMSHTGVLIVGLLH